MAAPRLDEQLCFALYTASRLVIRSYRPLLDELGITYPQYLVMMVLWQAVDEGSGPQTVGGLGARLHLDSGTLTPLLKRLEHLGFIRRERSLADERQVLVSATEEGAALAERAGPMRAQLMCEFGGELADLRVLRSALRGLNETLLQR
jgi:DNA-binding MarR family transcriptional regulator